MSGSTDLKQLFLQQWLGLALVLLTLLGLGAANLYQSHQRTGQREQERLLAMAKVVAVDLEQNLDSVNRVLSKLQMAIPGSALDTSFNTRLSILADAMPSIRTLSFNDISGTIRATSRPELLGSNQRFTERDYFQAPLQHPSFDTLFVSAPFRTSTGVFSIALSRMVAGPHGEFAGVLVATLDPSYYFPLLDSVRYADDSFVGLTHGNGVVFLMAPLQRATALGKNLAQPGSVFLEHRQSGQTASVISGVVRATGEQRMTAQHTVQPAGLKMNHSLEVAVSRLSSAIYESWWSDVWERASYFLTFTVLAALALRLYQRRTARFTLRAQRARAALEASERFTRAVTDNVPGLVAYWSSDLRCQFANARYLEFFGKTAEQVRGIHIRDLLGVTLFRSNEPYISAVLQGQPQRFERTLTKADGTTSYTYAQYLPDWRDDQVKGFYVLVADVTPLKQTELAMLALEQFARTTIDAMPEHICVIDKNGVIVTVNQAWRDFYLQNHPDPANTDCGIGVNYLDICQFAAGPGAEQALAMAAGIRAVLDGQHTHFVLEYPCHSPTESRTFRAQVTRFHGDSSNLLISHEDITERKLAEQKLQQSEARYRLLAENSQDMIWTMDLASQRFTYVSPSVEKLRGYTPEEVMAQSVEQALAPESQAVVAAMQAALQRIAAGERTELTQVIEVWQPHRDGRVIPTEVVASMILDGAGRPSAILGVSRDITERKKAQEALERMAHTDSLTGLANRRHFMQQAEQELARTVRYGGQLSVLMLDIDHFKQVNDRCGHHAGDLVLQALASVCRATLRAIDVIGRIGGEEFAVVLPQTDAARAFEAAERLRLALAEASVSPEPGVLLRFTVSIGIATLADPKPDIDTLLRLADQALYQAKHAGRNRTCVQS